MARLKRKKRKTSTDIFGAVSAPLRLQILKLLNAHSSLGYSEIMSQLNLNPNRDAGKFAYHLRTLLKAGMIEADQESKKYRLTTLGTTMFNYSQDIDERIWRGEGKLSVRTSRLAMEEFDRNKIAQALNREAGIPLDLAKRISAETEERLLKLDKLHLTASLIREFVNALLIEKGLQEYRQRHTRLGLPVYDITQLFKNAEVLALNVEDIQDSAGKTVMQEYVFLNVLPRRITDAHLSGNIHVSNASSWVSKPDAVQHDLRVFLQNGFKINRAKSNVYAINAPKTFEAALALIEATIHESRKEVVREQGLGHFNVFLAPYVKGMFLEDLRRILRRFVFSLSYISNRDSNVSIGLDFTIPRHLKEVKAVDAGGESTGSYDDYLEEALKILVALQDVMVEDDAHQPLLTPRLTYNLTKDALHSKEIENILIKTHELAAKWGIPHFINLSSSPQQPVSYFSNGIRLASDWTGDWELDTVRTGLLGNLTINLPRLAYEFPKDENRFLRALNKYLKASVDALKIKYNAIKKRLNHTLLPLASKPVANEPYIRLRNMSLLISFVGLNEATQMQIGKQLHEDQGAVDYATRIIGHMVLQAKKLSWKSGFRIGISPSIDSTASSRFAALDTTKYGQQNGFTQVSESTPYYTDHVIVPLEADITLEKRLRIESVFHPLLTGGHSSYVELEEPERSPEALLKMTRQICKLGIKAYAYTRCYSFCLNCNKVFGGIQTKCPQCKTVNNFIRNSRLSSDYLPLNSWSLSQKTRRNERKRYLI